MFTYEPAPVPESPPGEQEGPWAEVQDFLYEAMGWLEAMTTPARNSALEAEGRELYNEAGHPPEPPHREGLWARIPNWWSRAKAWVQDHSSASPQPPDPTSRQMRILEQLMDKMLDRKMGPLLDQKLAPLISGQAEVRAELAGVRAELAGVHGGLGEVRAELVGVRGGLGEVRAELVGVRGGLGEVRTELAGLRGDLSDFRGEVRTEFSDFRAEVAELRHINQKVLADISEIWGSDFEDLARGDLERALGSVYVPLLRWGYPSCNIFFSDQLYGNQVLPAVQILGLSRSEITTHLPCDALAIVTFPDNPVNPAFRCLAMMEASVGLDRGDVQKLVTKVQWLRLRLRDTDPPLRHVLPCIMSREFTQGALEHAQEHHILPFAQQGDRKWGVPGVPGADAPAADTPAHLAWRAAGLPHPH